MVTWQPISSFLFIPKDLMVYLALEVIGFWPDKSDKTLMALVSLSPEAPVDFYSISEITFIIFISSICLKDFFGFIFKVFIFCFFV